MTHVCCVQITTMRTRTVHTRMVHTGDAVSLYRQSSVRDWRVCVFVGFLLCCTLLIAFHLPCFVGAVDDARFGSAQ